MKPHSPAVLKLFAIIIILSVSCGQPTTKKTTAPTLKDTTHTLTKAEQDSLERRRFEEEERTDSTRLAITLNEALKIADQLKNRKRFKKEYVQTMPDDSSYEVQVTISKDFHFTNESPHLIICREARGQVYIDIFSTKNMQYQKVVSHQQAGIEYTGDTIRDINGDGLKDFVVNWYGSSGCCLKAFSNIYLLRADKRTFSPDFEFINPTFSPREKMIRGVCYGHPGETEMYKYKWNGEAVDTIEYISHERNEKGKTGKIIISNKPSEYSANYKILRKLNAPPKEYKKIDGYGWWEGPGD